MTDQGITQQCNVLARPARNLLETADHGKVSRAVDQLLILKRLNNPSLPLMPLLVKLPLGVQLITQRRSLTATTFNLGIQIARIEEWLDARINFLHHLLFVFRNLAQVLVTLHFVVYLFFMPAQLVEVIYFLDIVSLFLRNEFLVQFIQISLGTFPFTFQKILEYLPLIEILVAY